MTPLISIIVPCYNAAKHIQGCFASIQAQSITDYEIIFVNDGSSDETPQILDNIANLSNRIHIIHKVNGGVSSARNVALDVAKGKYITFVDIDDKLTIYCLEIMLRLMKDDEDVVFAGYKKIQRGYNFRLPTNVTREYSKIELAKELFTPTDFPYLGYPWAKLFRRSVIEIHHIRFDERIKYNEDRLFTFTFLAHSRKGIYTTEPVYEYYIHGGNAMSAIEGPGYWKFETDLDAFVEMNKIAPLFNSKIIKRHVWQGTITSYRWNMRLNRLYGSNDANTKKRLKKKLASAVPLWFRTLRQVADYYYSLRYKLNILIQSRP